MKNIKQYIPNILTIIRMILTVVIVIVGTFKYTKLVIILAVIAAITDLLDGRLARKWGVTSIVGAKLDAVADKLFSIGIIGSLITHFKVLWIPLILEIILGGTNLYYHVKTDKTKSLMIGKIKTVFLFTTVIIAITSTFYPNLLSIMNGLLYATINLQVLSIISYGYNFLSNKEEATIKENKIDKETEKMEESKELTQTIILGDLQKLAQQYNYDNTKDDVL